MSFPFIALAKTAYVLVYRANLIRRSISSAQTQHKQRLQLCIRVLESVWKNLDTCEYRFSLSGQDLTSSRNAELRSP